MVAWKNVPRNGEIGGWSQSRDKMRLKRGVRLDWFGEAKCIFQKDCR